MSAPQVPDAESLSIKIRAALERQFHKPKPGDCITPILASALSEATREGLREAAGLTCRNCRTDVPMEDGGRVKFHVGGFHCLASQIWRRLEKGKGEV